MAITAVMAALLLPAAAQGPAQTPAETKTEAGKPAADPLASVPLENNPCEVPGYILFGESKLEHVKKAVQEHKKLTVLVLGSGSSLMPGPDGAGKAYPGRLEEVLRKRFPQVDIQVVALAKSRQLASDMAQSLEKALLDRKPDLVIWQTGTVDAMRGVDPESFRASLDDGIDHVVDAGADVILMNMQYSPRTETLISLSNYADIMRVVARDRDVPLFDRREIMRHWNDNGNFDLNLATKDLATAYKVHDCLGRALASLVVEAADLDGIKARPTQ
ncbi:SGNH/GDSL hydrolase family protein [Pseudorhodoplanes sp.]|uniref:SGNH/GDSL hydrolase family protein n=1 Tax=Pseudorhodoplanes sp. TaxID=1934341 RepID=UPI002C94535F|nr:GDSL-type esterase/lipase family protein [Pseudorhodoplanes sp.]HWV40288.1 GDSL-type esterase/lipase family protein [Pseudorhodoplanes sp.]